MNLLDTASLVVTPNGYKASKLYSIVPSDGSGDMTFARTGDTATRVNSSGLIETVLANKPRLDYLDGTCPKLLLEPQRTNLVNYSDAFDNAYWSKDGTITANSVISPDGTQNADTWTCRSSYSFLTKPITLTNSTAYSVSIFIKKSNYRYVGFGTYQTRNGENFNTYDFDTNTVNNTIAPSYPLQFVNYPNGWVRLIMNFTTTSTSQTFALAFVNSAGYGLYTPPAGSAYYIYGAQLEAGAYATSYIPTTTASVTRNADSCSKTSINSLIGGTSGTILFNITTNPTLTTEIYKQFTYYLSATSQQGYMFLNQNNKIATSPSWGSMVSSNTLLPNTTYKVALGFSPLNHVLYVNGVQVATSTTGTPYDSDKITSLLSYNGSGEFGEFKLNSFAHWKTKLTNQELVTLTTI